MGSWQCKKRTSALVLVVINCVLLAGGIGMLVAALRVRNTAWIDVLREYASATDEVLTAIEVAAGVVIALAALGSVAALCHWRIGLLLYAIVISIFALAFGVAAAALFVLRNTASDWRDATYPASTDESTVKREFDTLYCAAQGAYICNSLTASDAVAMFAPQLNASTLLSGMGDTNIGVATICASPLRSAFSGLDAVCDGCKTASAFTDLTDVLDWANDQCPRTAQTLIWCGAMLSAGVDADTAAISVGTAPYTECRAEFLDLTKSTALYVGLVALGICIVALVAAGLSCYLRRSKHGRRRSASGWDDRERGDQYTPTTNAPYTKD